MLIKAESIAFDFGVHVYKSVEQGSTNVGVLCPLTGRVESLHGVRGESGFCNGAGCGMRVI